MIVSFAPQGACRSVLIIQRTRRFGSSLYLEADEYDHFLPLPGLGGDLGAERIRRLDQRRGVRLRLKLRRDWDQPMNASLLFDLSHTSKRVRQFARCQIRWQNNGHKIGRRDARAA